MSKCVASTKTVGVPVCGTEVMLQRWLSIIGPSAVYNGSVTASPVVTQPPEGWLDLTQYSFDRLNICINVSLVNNALNGAAANDYVGTLSVLSGYCLGQPDAVPVSLAGLNFRLKGNQTLADVVSTVAGLNQVQPIVKSNPNLGRYLFWRLDNIPTQRNGVVAGNETLVCFEIKLQLIGG
jgi:hypothetical protein